jgi:hypothetical protein
MTKLVDIMNNLAICATAVLLGGLGSLSASSIAANAQGLKSRSGRMDRNSDFATKGPAHVTSVAAGTIMCRAPIAPVRHAGARAMTDRPDLGRWQVERRLVKSPAAWHSPARLE